MDLHEYFVDIHRFFLRRCNTGCRKRLMDTGAIGMGRDFHSYGLNMGNRKGSRCIPYLALTTMGDHAWRSGSYERFEGLVVRAPAMVHGAAQWGQ